MELAAIPAGLAAVDDQGMAGHKVGVITRQKDKGPSYIFGGAQAPQGDNSAFP